MSNKLSEGMGEQVRTTPSEEDDNGPKMIATDVAVASYDYNAQKVRFSEIDVLWIFLGE